MKRTICPCCGEPKIEVHNLENGKLGAWCSSCLKGVPNDSIPAADTIEEVIQRYEEFEAAVKLGKS